LIVAGTEEAILMVEAGANGVSEAEILDALDIAHSEIKKLCAAMQELQRRPARRRSRSRPQHRRGLIDEIRSSHGQALVDAIATEASSSATRRSTRSRRRSSPSTRPETDDGEPTRASADGQAASPRSRTDTIRKAIASTRSVPTAAPRTRSGRSSAR
jgi:polyribonucleotide nucleotidyltransferase